MMQNYACSVALNEKVTIFFNLVKLLISSIFNPLVANREEIFQNSCVKKKLKKSAENIKKVLVFLSKA
jgi:hypothetical protein